jgi:hypothetical protein
MTPEQKETYNKIDRFGEFAEEIRNEILHRIKTVVETDPDFADDEYDLIKQTEIEFLERLSNWFNYSGKIDFIKEELYKFDKLRSNESMP